MITCPANDLSCKSKSRKSRFESHLALTTVDGRASPPSSTSSFSTGIEKQTFFTMCKQQFFLHLLFCSFTNHILTLCHHSMMDILGYSKKIFAYHWEFETNQRFFFLSRNKDHKIEKIWYRLRTKEIQFVEEIVGDKQIFSSLENYHNKQNTWRGKIHVHVHSKLNRKDSVIEFVMR